MTSSSGKSHGRRSLKSCGPWGCLGSDTTEQLHFHFSLSCIGEGNGNPLQCSCLENPKDGGAWWAAVCGVTQSRTRLKWLSSSSSSLGQAKKRWKEATHFTWNYPVSPLCCLTPKNNFRNNINLATQGTSSDLFQQKKWKRSIAAL